MKILALLAIAAVLAGCGGTRTVTRTVTVHGTPCDTPKLMEGCVVDYADEFSRHHDADPSGIVARCERDGTDYSCVVLMPNPTPGLCVGALVHATTKLGYLYFDENNLISMKVCDRKFGAA